MFCREWEQAGGQSEEWTTSEIPSGIPSQALGFPNALLDGSTVSNGIPEMVVRNTRTV